MKDFENKFQLANTMKVGTDPSEHHTYVQARLSNYVRQAKIYVIENQISAVTNTFWMK
jgi:hypothetical protein